jgi:hypothetical protein
MNAKKNLIHKLSISSALGLALALAASLPGSANAADQMKGGERQLHLLGIKTKADAEALKPGDTIAMVCSKCQTVFIERVSTEKGHIKTVTPGTTHACTGCNSTIEVVGHGKAKTDVVKHVCKACGDDSAFCCATKPGSGATKGMDKK